MFCSKCGEKLEGTIVFCPKCGTKVVSSDSGIGQLNDQVSNYPVQSATDTSKLMMIITGIILSLVGIGLIIYGVNLNNSLSSQLSSLFSSGSTNPGTVYIVFGIVGLIGGVILLIIGFLKKSNISNPNGQNIVNTGDKSSNGNGFAIAGLVLGILSIFGWGVPLSFIGIPLSIIGRSRLILNNQSSKMATVGLILNIIGLIITAIMFIIIFMVLPEK